MKEPSPKKSIRDLLKEPKIEKTLQKVTVVKRQKVEERSISFYAPKAKIKRLKIIAAERNTSIKVLLNEALDNILETTF